MTDYSDGGYVITEQGDLGLGLDPITEKAEDNKEEKEDK